MRPTDLPATCLAQPNGLDWQLLGLLRDDGRAPTVRLAAETGASRSTVQRRIAELCAAGVLYFHVDARWPMLGLGVRTLL
ncbi:Lrp/AsnC family transcriptional regulator [Streptomyces sp. NPDC003233]